MPGMWKGDRVEPKPELDPYYPGMLWTQIVPAISDTIIRWTNQLEAGGQWLEWQVEVFPLNENPDTRLEWTMFPMGGLPPVLNPRQDVTQFDPNLESKFGNVGVDPGGGQPIISEGVFMYPSFFRAP